MAYTTAENWLERFEAIGGKIEVDIGTMRPVAYVPMSYELEGLWRELRKASTETPWMQVEAEVRRRIGPFIGWATYPDERLF